MEGFKVKGASIFAYHFSQDPRIFKGQTKLKIIFYCPRSLSKAIQPCSISTQFARIKTPGGTLKYIGVHMHEQKGVLFLPYTAKLLFHQSPTRHSDYTVTTTVTM